MSKRSAEWLDNSFHHLGVSINNKLKNLFDEEAFSESPDYKKLTILGNLIDNTDFLNELSTASSQAKEIILAVLDRYGIKDTPPSSQEEPPIVTTITTKPQVEKMPIMIPSTVEQRKKELPVRRTEIPSDLQVFTPVINSFIESSQPPLLLIAALHAASTLPQKEKIFNLALSELGRQRADGFLGQNTFNRRFKLLLELDPTKDEEGEPTHGLIRGLLEKWMESENLDEIDLGEKLYSIISQSSLAKIYQRNDIEYCPARVVVHYLKDAAFWACKKNLFDEDKNQEDDDSYNENMVTRKFEPLSDILEAIIGRSCDDQDFMDDLITLMRDGGNINRPGQYGKIGYVQEAIERMAANGNEYAEEFLKSAWLK